jgi:hypothetical protein
MNRRSSSASIGPFTMRKLVSFAQKRPREHEVVIQRRLRARLNPASPSYSEDGSIDAVFSWRCRKLSTSRALRGHVPLAFCCGAFTWQEGTTRTCLSMPTSHKQTPSRKFHRKHYVTNAEQVLPRDSSRTHKAAELVCSAAVVHGLLTPATSN